MSETSDQGEEVGLLIAAKEAALKPVQYATSKTARRAYLSSVFVFFTGLTLLGLAITAYVLFYYSYIPQRGFTKPVYLQFDQGRNAYANVDLTSNDLVSGQPYDVNVKIRLPRTASNLAAGNFMVALDLLAPPSGSWNDVTAPEVPKVIIQERRPAILTYYSTALRYLHNAARLPLYVAGIRTEAETLTVKMFEGVEFGRGRNNRPATARLELQSGTPLQVYDISISFMTRLRGLRYLMYNYKVTTFIILTTIFWSMEMTIAGLFWIALPLLFSSNIHPSATKVDETGLDANTKEEVDSVDTRGDTGVDQIKKEETVTIKKEESQEPALELYPVATEADIEDEGDEEDSDEAVVVDDMYGAAPSDSGIGTSRESALRRANIRKRSMKNLRDD